MEIDHMEGEKYNGPEREPEIDISSMTVAEVVELYVKWTREDREGRPRNLGEIDQQLAEMWKSSATRAKAAEIDEALAASSDPSCREAAAHGISDVITYDPAEGLKRCLRLLADPNLTVRSSADEAMRTSEVLNDPETTFDAAAIKELLNAASELLDREAPAKE